MRLEILLAQLLDHGASLPVPAVRRGCDPRPRFIVARLQRVKEAAA
jgi:hypothetical protein